MLKYFMLISLSCMTLLGCSSYEVLFEIDAQADFEIKAGSNPTQIHLLYATSLFPYDFQLSNINIQEDMISEVVASNAQFYSKFTEEDLDFIHVIEVLVVNPDNPMDTQEIFYFDPIPVQPKTIIRLNPSLPNMRRFIKNDQILVKIECTYRRIPPKNYDMRLDMVFAALEVE